MDENDVVAMQMGAQDARSLTKKQSFYLDKIKAKLAQVSLREEAQFCLGFVVTHEIPQQLS